MKKPSIILRNYTRAVLSMSKEDLCSYVILIFAITIGSTLCILYLSSKSIWLDEAFSMYYARNLYIFGRDIVSKDGNMLLYYFILHYWMRFGNSEFTVRLLSVIFAVLTIPAIYLLGKDMFNKKAGAIAAFLLSMNVVFIAYSQETRGYSLLLLLLTISCILFFKLLKNEVKNKSIISLYIFSSIFAVYAHFFAVLILIAQLFSVLYYRTIKKIYKKLFILVLIPIASFLPILLFSYGETKTLTWIPVPKILNIVDVYYYLLGGKYITYIFILTLGYLMISIRRSLFNNRYERWKIVYLLNLLILPVLLAFLISVIFKPIFISRYLIIILIPFAILFGLSISKLTNKFLQFFLLLIVLILSMINIHTYYFDSSYKKDDWRNATRFVMDNYSKKDIVLFYLDDTIIPFNYYVERDKKNIKIEYKQLIRYNSNEIRNITNSRVWLVLNHYALNQDTKQQTSSIEKALGDKYHSSSIYNYSGIKVEVYPKLTQ